MQKLIIILDFARSFFSSNFQWAQEKKNSKFLDYLVTRPQKVSQDLS